MKYIHIGILFVLAWALNAVAPGVLVHLGALDGVEAALAVSLWCIGIFLLFGWACSWVAEGTVFPNFTLQLLIGIVMHDALAPLSTELTLSVVVCTALAAIILKSGGDEIDRQDFARIAFPTVMIAIGGYLVTFLVMFPLLIWIGLDGKTAALLAAIIGSTDQCAASPKRMSTLARWAVSPSLSASRWTCGATCAASGRACSVA